MAIKFVSATPCSAQNTNPLLGLRGLSGITLICTVNLTTNNNAFMMHAADGGGGVQRYALREITTAFRFAVRRNTGDVTSQLDGTVTPTTGKVWQVVGTANFVGSQMDLYENGALDATMNPAGWGGVSDNVDPSILTLGARSDLAANFLNGTLDMPMIIPYYITLADVKKIYGGGSLPGAIPAHQWILQNSPIGTNATGAGSILDTGSATASNLTPVGSPAYVNLIAPGFPPAELFGRAGRN